MEGFRELTEQLEIEGYDRELYQRIRENWDHVAKPLDGMGKFEDLLARIGAIQGRETPELQRTRLIVSCADNGIVEEGVSQSGQEVTAICAASIANGRSSVAIMAREAGIDVLTVDVGINSEEAPSNVRNLKVRRGTRNFLREPAMTGEETLKAICAGMGLVRESKAQGYSILCMGEMGIGNTSTSSAITAALLGIPAEMVTGRGAGLDDKGLLHKREVIRKALEKYGWQTASGEQKSDGKVQDPDLAGEAAFQVLANVGGLDVACMTGICLGGAKYRVPIVLDGFISFAAALVACRLEERVKEFLIPSHSGKEPAMKLMEDALGVSPVIYANMALGEGTGAVLMMQLLKTANAVYEQSTSFEKAGIRQYERFSNNEK